MLNVSERVSNFKKTWKIWKEIIIVNHDVWHNIEQVKMIIRMRQIYSYVNLIKRFPKVKTKSIKFQEQ